ncbi:MAG: PD-(D/E)XK nuclease domain-containing protein, partial [Saprospiraceae bacterium]|nr:PD-(D/E)XK nuclease domain-containing protein [Saprospiraceae bacterium]
SSDYGKIRRMFRVGNEGENLAILEQIVRDGAVQAAITAQFSFEKRWTRDDFISLLFYMGLLTIKDAEFGQLAFQVPNHVITELYYRYFQEILSEQANLRLDDMRLTDRLIALAKDDDIGPIAEALQTVLERLSNRDARGFDEKYVKATLMALLVPAGVYGTFSEYPVGQGYADIVLWRRPPILEPKHQHLLEVKHLKKRDAAQLAETAEEGRAQLRRYLAHPDIARRGDVLGWLLVVVGYEVAVAERVG